VNQVVGNGKFAFFPFVQTSNETVLTLIYIWGLSKTFLGAATWSIPKPSKSKLR
jgi:hypothetical protein